MKRIFFTILAITCDVSFAQPRYFSEISVRDDLARRTGAYEYSCDKIVGLFSKDELSDSSCLFITGINSKKYLKSTVDIFYSEYMDGGWKIYNKAISNYIGKDNKHFEITIYDFGDSAALRVFDTERKYSRLTNDAAAEAEKYRVMQAAKRSRLAIEAGATPGIDYVRLTELKRIFSIEYQKPDFLVLMNGVKLSFSPNNHLIKSNDKSIKIVGTPFVIDGSAYIPLDTLSIFGCEYIKSADLEDIKIKLNCDPNQDIDKMIVIDRYTF